MIKLRLIPLLLICIWLSVSAPQAQNDDVLSRQADESATTTEERQRSLATLLTAASQFRDSGEALKAARFLNRAGRLQLKLNSPQDALATFQDALTILKQTPDPTIHVDSLNGMSAVYNRLSNCDEAQTFLQQAIALSEQNNYVAGKAEALLTLSDCRNYHDQALAVRTAQEALALWKSINFKLGMARSYIALGDYQLSQSNLTEATQNSETALNLARELNVADQQAEALINLGFIEYRKGAWQNVFTFLTQAQALLDEKAEPYKMGQIAAGLADAFIESGLPETGLVKYLEALEYFRQTQNPRSVVSMVWGIGKTYYLLGDYPKALENLQRALADAESIKESKFAALCNDSLGRTFAALNDHTAALRHFEVALDLYTRAGNPMEAARVRALMGQVYQQQGKIEKARKYYQRGLETFVALSDHVNQSATLYALGRLELERDNLSAAEVYLRQAIEVTENVRRVSTSRDLTAAFSATVNERYESYVEYLMRRHQEQPSQGFAVRAFEINDLGRARSLAELLRAMQTNLATGLDPQLAEQEKAIRQLLRVKEDDKVALLGTKYKKEELTALDAEIARLDAEYKRINEIIRARYPSYEQITRPTAWDLRQLQEQVIADDQTVLLEYSLGADKSYLWAVTHNNITPYELPAQPLITEAAQKVYKLLATPPDADTENNLTQATQELSRIILSPVIAELNKRQVIIVADGALNYIPFQVLPMPSANNELLSDNCEVINVPSASILGELRQEAARRQPPSKVLVAFGAPVFESNYAQRKDTNGSEHLAAVTTLETGSLRRALRDIELNGESFDPSVIKPLFYARRELANLLAVAAGGETFVATDYDASREKLLSMDLTKFAILHFATHGLLDPKRVENSGLVLSTVNRDGQAQNGFVGLQDIYSLRAPVDLVVLSACQTGLGKDVRGEGLVGLTRGFMYAGASSVVASLWKVDDEATAELMKQFYINMLQKRMTPAAALRAAQSSIRQKPEWRSPYYWAAFTLQGEYRQVIKPTLAGATPIYPKVIVGGALLALLASFAWWRGRQRKMKIMQKADSYSTVK
jgi:CHAT domain-containing protein